MSLELEYLKSPHPHDTRGPILVMEDITLKITSERGARGCSKEPENPIRELKRGEFLECRGGSDSSFYIRLTNRKETVTMDFGEYDRIKTLQEGDCVRINTPTGHQIGKVHHINTDRDWIWVNELKGTQEYPCHPAGDTIFVGIDNILAIDKNFDRIFTTCKELRKQ